MAREPLTEARAVVEFLVPGDKLDYPCRHEARFRIVWMPTETGTEVIAEFCAEDALGRRSWTQDWGDWISVDYCTVLEQAIVALDEGGRRG